MDTPCRAFGSRGCGELDPKLLGDFLARLAEHDPEHDWDRHTIAAFAALGARAAEHGVALRTLVDLYLSAAWRAWPQLPAVAGENARAIRTAGHWALRLCIDVIAALAEGHTSAGRAVARREETMHRKFVDDLLTGTADPIGLMVQAQSYGLQLAYRLRRIATLTGLHPSNPAHRYTLHTAVLGARALGWPDDIQPVADARQGSRAYHGR